MASAKEKTLALLGTVSGHSLNGADSTIFTVPPGKSAIVTQVILADASASVTGADVGLGGNAGVDDWRTGVGLNSLDAAGKSCMITPYTGEDGGEATPLPGDFPIYAAGAAFKISNEITAVGTVDVYAFGFLI